MFLRRFPKARPRQFGFITRLYRHQHPPLQARFYFSNPSSTSITKSRSNDRGSNNKNANSAGSSTIAIVIAASLAACAYYDDERVARKLWGAKVAVPDLDKLKRPGDEEISYSPVPSSDDVTRQLNKTSWSVPALKRSISVDRYDGAQLMSNSPCGDAYLHARFTKPFASGRSSARDWMAWAVFDGHYGSHMSDLLARELIPAVRSALSTVPKVDTQLGHRGRHPPCP